MTEMIKVVMAGLNKRLKRTPLPADFGPVTEHQIQASDEA